ncbi:MAG TPA: hypothetical protein VKM55_09225 [Candidatus Lokiarchaeia archaeon]|nr:hypothetical protein [Candidatus Lokiarchaeia archaeon]
MAKLPKPPSRESVQLKKVETKKQDVNLSDGEVGMMKTFESDINPKAALTNDEITIVNILEKKKLFLTQITIEFNSTRQTMGMPLFKAKDFQGLLDGLASKGLVTSRDAPGGKVFFLTPAGLEFLDLI